MLEIEQAPEFQEWRCHMKDELLKTAVAARLTRLSAGNKGNHRYVGEGII